MLQGRNLHRSVQKNLKDIARHIFIKEMLKLNYIDDETFAVLDSGINIELGVYSKIYQDVLISKTLPGDVGVLCSKAIDLYFDYHSDEGKLAEIVKANAHKDKMELISLLLEKSEDYGLSDLQAERLINRIN